MVATRLRLQILERLMNSEKRTEGSRFSPQLTQPNAKMIAAHLPTIPVSIVSNSGLLREGLAQLLAPYLTLHVICVTAAEPIGLDGSSLIGGQVVMVDCAIGHVATMSWIRYCCSLSPSVYSLLLQMPDDAAMILAAIEAGANNYAPLDASTHDIAHIIRVTYKGGAVCSPRMTAHLFARLATRAKNDTEYNRDSPLTLREAQVLGLIARGYSNKEIAVNIVVTVRTVKHHVHNILHKLNVPNRHDAVRRARAEQWIEQ